MHWLQRRQLNADAGAAKSDRTVIAEKLIKIVAKVVSHSPHLTFQMAEVAVSR